MPDALITLASMALGDVPTPDPGEFTFFVDTSDGLAKYKDAIAVVRILGPGVASSLLTADTPNPMLTDGTTPLADQALLADSPTQGSWAYIPGFLKIDPAVETGNFVMVGRKLKIANIVGGSLFASLPLANSLPVDTICGVKLEREAGGNTLTVQRQGADTIDKYTTPKTTEPFTADGAVAYFRTDGSSIWYIV